jgi:hypothetical protein
MRPLMETAAKRQAARCLESLNDEDLRRLYSLRYGSRSTDFYSGLAQAPDAQTLFYSKQTDWTQGALIENFQSTVPQLVGEKNLSLHGRFWL